MTTTRCKFRCQSITKRVGWNGHPFVFDAEFSVVTENDHRTGIYKDRESLDACAKEDAAFFAATPGGRLNVATVAADVFEVGKAYYLDITKVEE